MQPGGLQIDLHDQQRRIESNNETYDNARYHQGVLDLLGKRLHKKGYRQHHSQDKHLVARGGEK
ncbi:MAG: hypothetical protein ACD_75C00024G0005 [uncultured bacterium]|nr:MAG: hypothetical protein ACD_75C00024G0005 [uncultured bacterium]